MVCKRKNTEGSQQPLTPCKQPRCTSAGEGNMEQRTAEEGRMAPDAAEEGQMAPDAAEEGQMAPYAAEEGQMAPDAAEEGQMPHPQEKDEGHIGHCTTEPQTAEQGHTSHHMSQEGHLAHHPAEKGDMAHPHCTAEQASSCAAGGRHALSGCTVSGPVMGFSAEARQSTPDWTVAGPEIPPDALPGSTGLNAGETRQTSHECTMTESEIPFANEDEPCCNASSLPYKTLSANRKYAPYNLQIPFHSENEPQARKGLASETFGPCEPLHVNQLPSSLLLKIFSNLTLNERCILASLVCKYWRDLCLDSQFWKQLDLSNRQQVKDKVLSEITSRSQNITEINISDCFSVSDHGVCLVAVKCPGLVKYTAYRCKQLSDMSLIVLANHCTSLQKVHVGNQDKLSDDSLKALGKWCKELRDIHFGQCYKISDKGLIVIAKGCQKLQKIYLQENKLFSLESPSATSMGSHLVLLVPWSHLVLQVWDPT
uniref:F-box and leucine-rich repeat protein 17 n=2 Tax=Xenopus tropicalis TaxID=8364 RepID=A0A803JSI9_XENTR